MLSPSGFSLGPAEKLASRGAGGFGISMVFAGSRPTIAIDAVLTGAVAICVSGGRGSSVAVFFTSALTEGGGTKVFSGCFVSSEKSVRIVA